MKIQHTSRSFSEVGERKPARKERLMADVPPHTRSAELWLTVDDVIARIGIKRTLFWEFIKTDKFPAPYYSRGRALWTQADVKDFINKRVNPPPKKPDGIAVTWDGVASLLKERAPEGLTNLQIAHLLGAIVSDVSSLTRLMAKAGVLIALSPVNSNAPGPKFYVYNDGSLAR